MGLNRRGRELLALGELAGEYADRALTSTVEGIHAAIANRSFKASGAVAGPARVGHDAISSGVYGAIRAGTKSAARAAAAIAAVRGANRDEHFSDSRFGSGSLAAINGLIGDRLAEERSELAFELRLRHRGCDVEVEREALARAFPQAGPRLAVFIHGLCEDEEAWGRGEGEVRAGSTYGAQLLRDGGWSPLFVRYNSGLRIAANGRELSWLLDALRREWPVAVSEIALIGHSMGGLLARSACHEAEANERPWLEETSHVICLGAPNKGSWLEKIVNVGGWSMAKLPEARPLADFLNLRSIGIRDLRFGYIGDSDWAGRDPDELHLRDAGEPLEPVAGVEYHYVSGSLATSPRHPLSALFGDSLVAPRSAAGPRLPVGALASQSEHLPGVSHFRLLNDPRVYELIRGWLQIR